MGFQLNYLKKLNKLITNNLFKSRKNSILLFGIALMLWQIFFVFSISRGLQFQIYNLLILAGIWLVWEQITEDRDPVKISKKTFSVSIIIILMTLIRGSYTDSIKDIFFYVTIPILNFGLIALYDGIELFKKNLHLILLSNFVPLREIFLLPLEKYLVPLTSNITWFTLKIIGINANITNNIIFFENRGISVEDGCSGADQIIFGISLLMIFYILFPIKKRINFYILITLTIISSFLENCMRLSFLAYINSYEGIYSDKLFDFFHNSFGSLIFTSLTFFIVSKSYFEIIKREIRDL